MPTGDASEPEARGVVVAMRGRRHPHLPSPGPLIHEAGNAARDPDPLSGIAQTIEALHRARGRTLTDEPTREAYDIAMEAALLMLDGAYAKGHVTGEQHAILRGTLEGIRHVPLLL